MDPIMESKHTEFARPSCTCAQDGRDHAHSAWVRLVAAVSGRGHQVDTHGRELAQCGLGPLRIETGGWACDSQARDSCLCHSWAMGSC